MPDQETPDRLAEIAMRERRDSIPRHTVEQQPASIYFRLVEDRQGAWVAYANHNTILSRVEDRVVALTQARDTLTAEVSRLTKELLREGQAHEATINQRDDAQEWADQLASVAGGVEEIGEHSNCNNPWRNALELLEAQSAEVSRLREENSGTRRSNSRKLAGASDA